MLSKETREALKELARRAVAAAARGDPPPRPPQLQDAPLRCGAFVSLHRGGALRGCIGTFQPRGALAETVIEMARAASLSDPRFAPLRPDELADLEIEISVLSPLVPCDDPAAIEVGRHGLEIVLGRHSGVLLPQVASEYGWSREQFLAHLCLKAGLPTDAWKSPEAKLYTFEAEVF
jgi:uncharacterized protein